VIGTLLAERYRLDQCLTSEQSAPQGQLWRATDLLACDAPVAVRQLQDPEAQNRFRQLWPKMQSILHPLIPSFGGLLEELDSLWLVREWQEGTSFEYIQQQRRERQLVFGTGEVLLLLRQLLPALGVLHAKGLVHGDVNPGNLLRRDQDGLPILLDFGLLQTLGRAPLLGATASYAPRGQGRGEMAAPWMDVHALGVTALTLLSGRPPEDVLPADANEWRCPSSLDLHEQFRETLDRMLSEVPGRRFDQAADVLQALKAVPMPESTGPMPSSDRTVVLAPVVQLSPTSPASDSQADAATHSASSRRRQRADERQIAAEGRLWPVVMALLLSAVVGTAIGWFLLSRGNAPAGVPSTDRDVVGRPPTASLPPAEVDQRQQLLSRLRALQVDRSWFLKLVDASLLARFPERNGRLPSDSLEDTPLRKVWNELANEWVARVEQLPPTLRRRLGQLDADDWQSQRQALSAQGVNPKVVEQLVSVAANTLLPGVALGTKPPEPFRQLWFAAALRSLEEVKIETLKAGTETATVLSSRVPADGARLISIQVPPEHRLVLGINGTPLMQMTVYAADGSVVAERGPLRVVTLQEEAGSPVQVLVTNEGVASGLLTLSCRADAATPKPLSKPLPRIDLNPIADPATGAQGPVEALPEPPGPKPAGVKEETPTDSRETQLDEGTDAQNLEGSDEGTQRL